MRSILKPGRQLTSHGLIHTYTHIHNTHNHAGTRRYRRECETFQEMPMTRTRCQLQRRSHVAPRRLPVGQRCQTTGVVGECHVGWHGSWQTALVVTHSAFGCTTSGHTYLVSTCGCTVCTLAPGPMLPRDPQGKRTDHRTLKLERSGRDQPRIHIEWAIFRLSDKSLERWRERESTLLHWSEWSKF